MVATDKSTTSTLDQIRNFVFGTLGDAVNLKERFQRCSYGQTVIKPYNGTTQLGRIVPNGVYQVNITTPITGQYEVTIENAVVLKLKAGLGDLASQFDHIMYCLPPGTKDSDTGLTNWTSYGEQSCSVVSFVPSFAIKFF